MLVLAVDGLELVSRKDGLALVSVEDGLVLVSVEDNLDRLCSLGSLLSFHCLVLSFQDSLARVG